MRISQKESWRQIIMQLKHSNNVYYFINEVVFLTSAVTYQNLLIDLTVHNLCILSDVEDYYPCLNSPPQTAPSCMYYHHLQSRRFLSGCCWSWRSPATISEPGSSAWCHVESWDLLCPLAACSFLGSPHWGVCSSAPFPSEASWLEEFASESPPPESSAGWEHEGRC